MLDIVGLRRKDRREDDLCLEFVTWWAWFQTFLLSFPASISPSLHSVPWFSFEGFICPHCKPCVVGRLDASSDSVEPFLISVIGLGVYIWPKSDQERSNPRICVEAVRRDVVFRPGECDVRIGELELMQPCCYHEGRTWCCFSGHSMKAKM